MRINYPKNLPLVKIPQKAEFAIFLLKEELKSRKLTNDLETIGFGASICISDFSVLIFPIMGFDIESDDFYEWYANQMDNFCEEIDLEVGESVSEAAFRLYVLLCSKKRQMCECEGERYRNKKEDS